MHKDLKTVEFVSYCFILFLAVISFTGCVNNEKLNSAKAKSDYLIANLDNPNIATDFPPKYFPRNRIYPILNAIRKECDWKHRDGKFVDYLTKKSVGGIDQNIFIYEYYLKCDSLRFILTYNTDNDPVLMGFRVEPLEVKNPLILFPEKQLENR